MMQFQNSFENRLNNHIHNFKVYSTFNAPFQLFTLSAAPLYTAGIWENKTISMALYYGMVTIIRTELGYIYKKKKKKP